MRELEGNSEDEALQALGNAMSEVEELMEILPAPSDFWRNKYHAQQARVSRMHEALTLIAGKGPRTKAKDLILIAKECLDS